ncbi:MAG: carbonic anhydrase [Bacteroidia bacterium]|nr:carbonic anhydrase [Bacteroidia bacterium]MBT8229350.1 carbonic anhydrase [Bacteroidia bacterium]
MALLLDNLTQTKESQNAMSAQDALEMLKEGNKRFVSNTLIRRDFKDQINKTSSGQFPFAAIVSCIDSRIPTEVIFDQGIGDIFNARIAGNFVNNDILGSLEFACKLAGSKLIVIMGHTSCGAVKGACDHAKLGNLTAMLDKIKPAMENVKTGENEERNSSNIKFVNEVAVQNVLLTIENLRRDSVVLEEMIVRGEIEVVGAMYDVASGDVSFI